MATEENKPQPDATDATDAPAKGKVEVGRASTPISQQLGRVMMVVAGGIFALFAMFNMDYVDFSWVFGSSEVVTAGGERVTGGIPLIVLLIAAFVLGVIVGIGSAARRRRTKG